MTTQAADLTSSDGSADSLAHKVLADPGHGANFFYPVTASGTPLALTGFGFGLALLSLVEGGVLDPNTLGIVVPVAFGLSALATIVGGLWEFRCNNTFGSVWASTYGGFWISLGLILTYYGPVVTKAAGAAAFGKAFGAYLIVLAIVTLYMAVASYFVAGAACAAFGLLVVLEVVLGVANIENSLTLQRAGAFMGIVDAAIAMYIAAAILINTTAGKAYVPIWPYPYGRIQVSVDPSTVPAQS